MKWILISFILRFVGVHSACSLGSNLYGTWITTNFGNVTIQDSSPQLSMTQVFTGVAGGTTTNFNCLMISGSQYILQSNETATVFSGTTEIYIYMCIQFVQASTNSYIYYLNSDVESGLNSYRLVGLPISTSVTTASQVCTTTVDVAEYNTMVNTASTGYELGTVQCPTALLGNYFFTYTSGGTTYCDTVNATINSCNNQSLTGVLVDDSACDAANPFYSAGGVLGCVAGLSNGATYYTTLYNGDSSVDGTSTYRFSCVAITQEANGTVYISVSPSACVSAQSSTTAPSVGAIMVLTPNCVPISGETDYTVLIVLLCVFIFLIIVVIVIVVVCYFRYKKKKKEKKREKKMLVTDDHPLAERSIGLDTPATMEPVIFENRLESFRSSRRKKGFGTNPMGESSMNLDFLGGSWATNTSKPSSRMGIDPFTEMETGAIVPISPRGSKTARSIKSRQNSFVGRPYMNGDARKPLAITDSGFEDETGKSQKNGGVVSKRGTREMTRANSMVRAPSIRSARSIKAPSLFTESLRSNGALVRVGSIKGKGGSKPAPPRDKLTRSATSTRIGSVTRKKTMMRSKTVVVPTKTQDGPGGEKPEGAGMDDFMAGEVNTVVGSMSARSEGGNSKKSIRSNKTTKSKSMTARSTAPSRSSKRKSTTTVHQAAVIYMPDSVEEVPKSEISRNLMSKDLSKESFRTARELKDMRKRAKKPTVSKGPWK